MLACLDPYQGAMAYEVKTRDCRAEFRIVAKFNGDARRLTEHDLISAEEAKVAARQNWMGEPRWRKSDNLS
jgi:hypothetical protein